MLAFSNIIHNRNRRNTLFLFFKWIGDMFYGVFVSLIAFSGISAALSSILSVT